MKISPLIAKYLQEHNSLNLEGFGKFYLDQNQVDLNTADSKNNIINPIQYEYAPNLPTDLEFINFIVKETGKIRPLAIADLETFISLAKQLLNISKPFVIDGVGTLVKTTQGNFNFIPGNYEPPKINTDNEKDKKIRQAKDVNRESEIRYSKNYEEANKGNNKVLLRKILGALTLLLILGGAVWAIYHFILKKEDTQSGKPKASIISNGKDTGSSQKPVAINASATKPPVIDSLGRIEYKAVIKIADSANAYSRYNGLIKIAQKAVIYNGDSGLYKVAILVKSLPQDTAKTAETMHSYYLKGTKYSGFRVFLEQ